MSFKRAFQQNYNAKNIIHKNYSVKNEIQSCAMCFFFVKQVYKLKEKSLIQRAFRTEYPKDGTPIHSVIKDILSYFEKHGSVAHVPPKHKNLGQKREMVKNQLESLVQDFPLFSNRKATSAVGVSSSLVYILYVIFHDYIHAS